MSPDLRCLVPRFDGVIRSLEWKEAVWDRYVMAAPRPRRGPSNHTAIAGFARDVGSGVGAQLQDSGEVAEANDGRGYEDRAGGPSFNDSVGCRGSNGCRVPTIYPAAAGRLPLYPVAFDLAFDTLSAASVPAATRHLSPARHRRRQAKASTLQALTHRLLPHRYRRGADCRAAGDRRSTQIISLRRR